MIEDYTIDGQINQIVWQKVKRGEYPVPTPLVSDEVQRKELADLRAERIQRPPTKKEYFQLITTLQTEINSIEMQNKQITLDNSAARKAVDDKFDTDIAAAKLDEVNIGQALCNCINYQLNQTEWYVVKDNGLIESQQVKADAWRAAQMSIVYEEPSIELAVAKYDALVATKPKYELKWEIET